MLPFPNRGELMDWLGLAVNIATAALASGGFHFLFKEAIKAKLKKEVESDLSRLRHELDIKKEIIKNDLQRDAYKTQLMVSNVHQIYPELASMLEMTFGAVGGLQGVKFSTNYEQFNEEDLASLMEAKKFPKGKHDEILTRYRSDKKAGIKALGEFMRDVEIEEARQKCVEANNYRILKSIYCADDVLKAFDECYSALWGAWVDLDVGRMDPSLWKRGSDAIRKDVPAKMEAFRKVVRSELRVESKSNQ